MTEYDMLDFENNEKEEQEQEEQEEEEEEQEEEAVSDDDSDEEPPEDAKATNSLLTVGYNSDRSFVVRGSQIGVFKSSGNKLKYTTSIKRLKDSEGKTFSPKKVHLSVWLVNRLR
jgi:hypothetical protein